MKKLILLATAGLAAALLAGTASATCVTAPTFSVLTGKDATPSPQSMNMWADGSGHLWPAPIIHGWTGSAPAALTADANCILEVDIQAGNVGGFNANFAPTITVQNAAYSAGNSEGGLITIAAARSNGGSGIITSFGLRSTGGSTNTVWVYAFRKSPSSTCTDKSAFSFNSADYPYLIGGAPFSVTLGGSPGTWDTATYAALQNMTLNFKNADGSPGQNIYICLVTGGAVTPASTSDLVLVLGVNQDA